MFASFFFFFFFLVVMISSDHYILMVYIKQKAVLRYLCQIKANGKKDI